MPFITPTEIKSRFCNMLKLDVNSPPEWMDDLIEDALDAAYQDIVAALSARGFTQAQIDDWAAGPAFNKDIGLWWACVKAGAFGAEYNPTLVKELDRRKELTTYEVVSSGGTRTEPGGIVGRGTLKNGPDTFMDEDGEAIPW